MSIHEGHRARKKEQFIEHGLDAFADHEVLELLLYFAVPRQDTNPLAHRLVKYFGSLDAVLAADRSELLQVDGVGENVATLLTLIYPLFRRSRLSSRSSISLGSVDQAGNFFVDLFGGERSEKLYEACLDVKGALISCCLLSEGSADSIQLSMRTVVENALKCGASRVMLAHNHPSGLALPSPADNATTLAAYDALCTVGVELVDHFIVADEDFVSLRQNGLFVGSHWNAQTASTHWIE